MVFQILRPCLVYHFQKLFPLFLNQKIWVPSKFFMFSTLVSSFNLKTRFFFFFFGVCGSHAIFQNSLAMFWLFFKSDLFFLFYYVANNLYSHVINYIYTPVSLFSATHRTRISLSSITHNSDLRLPSFTLQLPQWLHLTLLLVLVWI